MPQEVLDARLLAERLYAAAWEDVQPHGEEIDAREAQHEARRAAQQHRDRGQEVVELGVLPKRGDDAEGHAEHDRDRDRRSHEDEGGWDAFPDLLGDRAPRLDREPEVTRARAGRASARSGSALAGRGRIPGGAPRAAAGLRWISWSCSGARRARSGSPGARDSATKLTIVIPIRTGIAIRIRRMMYVPTGQLG